MDARSSARRVGVDRHEQVAARVVRDRGALLERHAHVARRASARRVTPRARSRAARLRATASARSFSSEPDEPRAPVSAPPCPASITTVSKRSAAAATPLASARRSAATTRRQRARLPVPSARAHALPPNPDANVTHRPALAMAIVSANVARVMSRTLVILGMLALAALRAADEVACPDGARATRRGAAAGQPPLVRGRSSAASTVRASRSTSRAAGASRRTSSTARSTATIELARERSSPPKSGALRERQPRGALGDLVRGRHAREQPGVPRRAQQGTAKEWYPNGKLKLRGALRRRRAPRSRGRLLLERAEAVGRRVRARRVRRHLDRLVRGRIKRKVATLAARQRRPGEAGVPARASERATRVEPAPAAPPPPRRLILQVEQIADRLEAARRARRRAARSRRARWPRRRRARGGARGCGRRTARRRDRDRTGRAAAAGAARAAACTAPRPAAGASPARR